MANLKAKCDLTTELEAEYKLEVDLSAIASLNIALKAKAGD